MVLAMSSLPVPVSPWISTAESDGATVRKRLQTLRMTWLWPTIARLVSAWFGATRVFESAAMALYYPDYGSRENYRRPENGVGNLSFSGVWGLTGVLGNFEHAAPDRDGH